MTGPATVVGLQLEPVDTWYFADGMPSGADLTGGSERGGVFPPHPGSVVGAVRAAIARANGWSGDGPWPAALDEVLGDGYGPDSLGTLAFDGPYLLRDGVPLHQVPAHLLGEDEDEGADGSWRVRAAARPGEPVLCDLGEVRLPEPPAEVDGARPAGPGSAWLPAADLAQVLHGEPVGVRALPRAALWRDEPRVGIARNAATRTVQEQMLYTATHVRLARGVAVGIRVSGLPAHWHPADGELIPFGGEGRLARCRRWDGLPLAQPLTGVAGGRLTAVALTPLDIGPDACRGTAALADLGGATVASACLPGRQRIGGWRSVPRSEPLPLRSVLPPGSVLFCEGADPGRVRDLVAASVGPPRIGGWKRWGFGAVALGPWPGQHDGSQ